MQREVKRRDLILPARRLDIGVDRGRLEEVGGKHGDGLFVRPRLHFIFKVGGSGL